MFAFVKDNLVEKILDVTSEEIQVMGSQYSAVIDIEGMSPQPKVGWKFENGKLIKNLPDVTPRQIRQALIMSGVSLDAISTALNSLPEPTRSLAKAEWEYSIAVKRNRPLVDNVGAMLGWTEEQVDNLWLFASTFE